MAELIYTRDQIRVAVNDVATSIAYSVFKPDLMLVVMNGGMRFGSDLSERLHFHGINPEISSIPGDSIYTVNKKILLVDDIHDTGRSIEDLKLNFQSQYSFDGKANEVKIATLIYRVRPEKTTKPDYYGLKLTSMLWLYGYGLDLEFRERGNPNIYGVDPK